MKPALFVASLFLLTACDAGAEQRRETVEAAQEQAPDAPPAPFLVAAGAAEALEVQTGDRVQSAASVVRVDYLENQGLQPTVKLYGTAGGDPAMNGLYTYLAFFAGISEGWQVYRVGDFLDYRVIAEGPGRIDLEIDESVLDADAGDISSRTYRAILSWDPAGPYDAPSSVHLALAE